MDYTYISLIGNGNNSTVYRASRDGMPYVIKRVPIQYILSEMVGMIMADSVSNTHIMRPFRYVIDGNYIYTIMNEESGNIRSLINRDDLSEDTVYILMEQLIPTIGYLHHNGITHNLLVESNILVSGMSIQVSDFNLAGYGYSTYTDIHDLGVLMKRMYRDGFSNEYMDVVNALLRGVSIHDVLHMEWFKDYVYRVPDTIYIPYVSGNTYSDRLYTLSGSSNRRFLPLIHIIASALQRHNYIDTVLTNVDDIQLALSLLDSINYTLLV